MVINADRGNNSAELLRVMQFQWLAGVTSYRSKLKCQPGTHMAKLFSRGHANIFHRQLTLMVTRNLTQLWYGHPAPPSHSGPMVAQRTPAYASSGMLSECSFYIGTLSHTSLLVTACSLPPSAQWSMWMCEKFHHAFQISASYLSCVRSAVLLPFICSAQGDTVESFQKERKKKKTQTNIMLLFALLY